MTVINSLILFAVSIGAGFVQRVSGFGLGIFSMIFLPHLMPTQTVAAMSSVLSSLTSSYNAIRYRKNIVFRTAFPMICAALISIPVAVHFSQKVSADIFHILLSIVLILLSVYFLFFYKLF